MKIVHLCISAFYIDNYSYQENMLTKYHAKMGHNVTVIASLLSFDAKGKLCYLSTPSEYVNDDGVKVIRIDYQHPFYKINKFFLQYKGLYETIEREKPDIIFTHNIAACGMHTLARYMKVHPHTQLFGDNHMDYINSDLGHKNLKSIIRKHIWRYCAKEIEPYLKKCYGVTPMRCRYLEDLFHIDSDLIEFLPMGIDDESIPSDRATVRTQIRTKFGIKEDDFVIVTGGKIDKMKNIHILVKAIEKINDPAIHVVICGTIMEDMAFLRDQTSTNNNIHYLGWCNAETVINCMVAADIACFPGTHSTLWEQSVGIGLPAIFKRWPEMEHVNINGNCLFIKGEDVEELADCIRTMCNPITYNKKRELAMEVSQQFLYSKIASKAIGLS